MISVSEMERMREFKRKRLRERWAEKSSAKLFSLTLDGCHYNIHVSGSPLQLDQYDYVLSEYGIVKLLRLPDYIDKSPVCEKLDTLLETQLT